MQDINVQLQINKPRTYRQKKRLSRHLRFRGWTEEKIKAVCWHQDNSPKKGV